MKLTYVKLILLHEDFIQIVLDLFLRFYSVCEMLKLRHERNLLAITALDDDTLWFDLLSTELILDRHVR